MRPRPGATRATPFLSLHLLSHRFPAERLIALLSQSEVRRQRPIELAMELVKVVSGTALEEDFGQEELDKISRWRRQILQV